MSDDGQPQRPWTERNNDALDRRVVAAALQIQAQFEAMGKQIDQRVAANRELSDARLDTLRAVTNEHFAGLERALDIQATEYKRRLEDLNHEHARIAAMGDTYVRLDIYSKDVERTHTEQMQQNKAAGDARVAAENAAVINRRTTAISMVTFGLTITAIVMSVVLHFLPGSGG